MCIIQFLNDNAGTVQALLAAILVGVTIWYSISTKRMVNIYKKQLDLTSKPYCGINEDYQIYLKEDLSKPNRIADKTDFVEIKLKVVNHGQVPLKYTDASTFRDKTNSSGSILVLFPGQYLVLKSRFIIPEIETIKLKDELKVKLTYWSLFDEQTKFFFERRLDINGENHKIIADDAGKI